MNECLKKALVETNDTSSTPVSPKIRTTPEEITQRAYSNTKRSEGEVNPEFKSEYDSAFQRQQNTFNTMSDEAKKQAVVLWGDPRSPEYRSAQFDMSKVKFTNPNLLGTANTSTKNVRISADGESGEGGKPTPHEMSHIQQFYAQTDPEVFSLLRADLKKPYREQQIEAGAESKALVVDTRNKKSPQDSLKQLSDAEVESALEKTKSGTSNYTAFDQLPPEIQKELKTYMKDMIVTPKTQTQGTMA